MTTLKYQIREEAITKTTENGGNLSFCSTELQNDEEAVLAAIKEDEFSFQYASDKLKSNKAFILKAIHEGVYPWYLIDHSKVNIQSNLEVMTLAVEKSDDGFEFKYTKGEASLNKELAAKAIIKWVNRWGAADIDLWTKLHPTIQEFFPKDSWYEKAQTYLYQLEQEKQAELVTGGSTEEDGVVW